MTMPAVPDQLPKPGPPRTPVLAPSPRLWQMRCAEVLVAAACLAVLTGTGAGLMAGPAIAVLAAAVVLAGAIPVLWFVRNRFRSWSGGCSSST